MSRFQAMNEIDGAMVAVPASGRRPTMGQRASGRLNGLKRHETILMVVFAWVAARRIAMRNLQSTTADRGQGFRADHLPPLFPL
jgi:hypothetical protein